MSATNRFSYCDNGACFIVQDNKTGINRASCYSSEDAVAICDALGKMELAKRRTTNKVRRKAKS